MYVEGRTDEKYFTRAAEVFKFDLPFKFKWVGYLNAQNAEVNSGEKNLNKAFHFLIAMDLGVRNFCLKDCDTNSDIKTHNNVTLLSIKKYDSDIKKGIENALILDGIDMDKFYVEKKEPGDYGRCNVIQEFQKMALCNYLCSLDDEKLESVFMHLKEVIEKLMYLYDNKEGV